METLTDDDADALPVPTAEQIAALKPAPMPTDGAVKLKRSDIENATASRIAAWMRSMSLGVMAEPLPSEPIALAIRAAAVQSTLLMAGQIEGGGWREN